MSTPISEVLRDARRIVVKVGSSLVTNEGRGLDEQAIGEWCRQMAQLAEAGKEVVAYIGAREVMAEAVASRCQGPHLSNKAAATESDSCHSS